MRIGLIGAGLMGHGMAANLLKAGHEVIVIAHRNRQPIEHLVRRGAKEAAEFAGLVGSADVILLCVTNSRAVEEVIGRLKPHLKPGQVIVDTGTSEPDTNRRIAAELEAEGVAFAEAPVAGGPEQAEAAELGALVGADPQTFQKIRPMLECFCATVSHMGPVGAGQTAKLVSNYLVLGMVALIADTYNVASKAGVDWGKLYAAMLRGSSNSGALRKIVGPALEGNYDGYPFSLANAHKDMSYYMTVAGELAARSDMAEEIMATYDKALERGHGDYRVSRLIDPALQED